jgi:hypothetical protein
VCSEFPGLGDAHMALLHTPMKISGRRGRPDRCGNPTPGCSPATCSAPERVPGRRRRAVVAEVRPAVMWPAYGIGSGNSNSEACGGRHSGSSVGGARTWEGQAKPSDEGVHEEMRGGPKVEDARMTPGMTLFSGRASMVRIWSVDSGSRIVAMECAMATSGDDRFRSFLGTRLERWFSDWHRVCKSTPGSSPLLEALGVRPLSERSAA